MLTVIFLPTELTWQLKEKEKEIKHKVKEITEGDLEGSQEGM